MDKLEKTSLEAGSVGSLLPGLKQGLRRSEGKPISPTTLWVVWELDSWAGIELPGPFGPFVVLNGPLVMP